MVGEETDLALDFHFDIEPNSRSNSLLLHPRHSVAPEYPHREGVMLWVLLHIHSVPVRGMRDGKHEIQQWFILSPPTSARLLDGYSMHATHLVGVSILTKDARTIGESIPNRRFELPHDLLQVILHLGRHFNDLVGSKVRWKLVDTRDPASEVSDLVHGGRGGRVGT